MKYPKKMKREWLSHNLYYISDKLAGQLAKASEHGKLPKQGYFILVHWWDSPSVWMEGWLQRTQLTMLDKIKKKRGWVWTIQPIS